MKNLKVKLKLKNIYQGKRFVKFILLL